MFQKCGLTSQKYYIICYFRNSKFSCLISTFIIFCFGYKIDFTLKKFFQLFCLLRILKLIFKKSLYFWAWQGVKQGVSPALGDKRFSKMLSGRKRTQNRHENEFQKNKKSYISCITEPVNLTYSHSRLN